MQIMTGEGAMELAWQKPSLDQMLGRSSLLRIVVKYQNKLSSEIMGVLSLEVLKAWLNGAMIKLV